MNIEMLGKVTHKFGIGERGKIIGAYFIATPKGTDRAIVEWADASVYDKKQNVWNSHKGEMIQKVVEVHGLKKAYGISGLQYEDDFQVVNGVVHPLDTEVRTLEYMTKLYEENKSKITNETKRKRYEEILERNETKSFFAMERELRAL